ncbi:hypothetical protein CALVIDRAFT_532096, partial [Calocera viscosa TUFC12733]
MQEPLRTRRQTPAPALTATASHSESPSAQSICPDVDQDSRDERGEYPGGDEDESAPSLQALREESSEANEMQMDERASVSPAASIAGEYTPMNSLVQPARLRNGQVASPRVSEDTNMDDVLLHVRESGEEDAITTSASPSDRRHGRSPWNSPIHGRSELSTGNERGLGPEDAHSSGAGRTLLSRTAPDERMSVLMIVFEKNQTEGTVSGRARMKTTCLNEASLGRIIRHMFAPAPAVPSHGLCGFREARYVTFALATSRVPTTQSLGPHAFYRQPGHQHLGVLGNILSGGEALHDELEPMDQTAAQTQSFLRTLPTNVPRRWYNGLVYVFYLVWMTDEDRNLVGSRPRSPPRSPSPARLSAVAMMPVITRPRVADGVNRTDSRITSSQSPPMRSANRAASVQATDDDNESTHAVESGARRRARNRASSSRSRRPNGSEMRESARGPHFQLRSEFLNCQFPRVHEIMSGTPSLDQTWKKSIAWFIQRLQLLLEVATALAMPEVQESNVFVVPDCEGWNGRITADDLVA